MRAVEFKRSFDRSYQKLPLTDQTKVDEAIEELLSSLENHRPPKGLGLKRLRNDLWEARVDLKLRVGFRMQKNLVEFGVAGNHETIKKLLKN